MPVNFQFTRISDNEIVSPDSIDKILCELTGAKYNEKVYCWGSQQLHLLGSNPSIYASGSSVIDRELLTAKMDELQLTDDEKAIAYRFLIDEYRFSAWYTRGK